MKDYAIGANMCRSNPKREMTITLNYLNRVIFNNKSKLPKLAFKIYLFTASYTLASSLFNFLIG